MNKRKRLSLVLKSGSSRLHLTGEHETHTSMLKGEGSQNMNLGTVDNVVQRSLARDTEGRRRRRTKTTEDDKDTKASPGSGLLSRLGTGDIWSRIIPIVPPPTDRELFVPGTTLINGADGMQRHMAQRQFDGLMDDIFGRLDRAIEKGKKKMPERYQKPAVLSIETQVDSLRKMYLEALPKLIQELVKRNPGAPIGAVIRKAVQLLNEELAQPLYVLRFYTDAFEQFDADRYARYVRAMNFYFEQAFGLFAGALPTTTFKVGDLVLSRFGNMSLGTVPGRGPIGVHAFQLPFEMLSIMPINLPLMSHEARHNILGDIEPLERESIQLLAEIIPAAVASGRLKLSAKTYKVGRRSVPAEQLLVKFATDCLGEIDADLPGGALFSGPAFGRNMLLSFPAMGVRGTSIKDARELLRTDSVYLLNPMEDGSVSLDFEVHPPDFTRVHIYTAGLRSIGFGERADEFDELAKFAIGKDVPEMVTWGDAAGKSQTVIEIPSVDLDAMAAVIAPDLIHHKMKSLGGRSNNDCTTWNAKRQGKVDLLKATLLEGKADVPTGEGDMFATYIGAAGVDAYWEMVETGKVDPFDAAAQVSDNVLTMLETLQARTVGK